MLRRVLRIEESHGDLSEMMGMVASINANSEERQRRGAVIINDDPPGSGAGCPPPLTMPGEDEEHDHGGNKATLKAKPSARAVSRATRRALLRPKLKKRETRYVVGAR